MNLRAVVYLDSASIEPAAQLCVDFDVPCMDGSTLAASKPKSIQRLLEQELGSVANECAFVLGKAGLQLVSFDPNNAVAIAANFHGATTTYRRLKGGGKGQTIAKAVGIRAGVTPRILDATAGLGGDSFVFASLGSEVSMIERVPVVRHLLADGLEQATRYAAVEDAELMNVLQRMQLIEADSLEYLKQLPEEASPDVIYLDPMFPERTKQSLVKKEMRVVHSLVGSDPDADQLLSLAIDKARYRVVVKRPRLAPYLSGVEPKHVLSGKSNRYDLYTKLKIPDDL